MGKMDGSEATVTQEDLDAVERFGPRPILLEVDTDLTWLQKYTKEKDHLEENFAAGIITFIDAHLRTPFAPGSMEKQVRRYAELAILQIRRHNEGKLFDSVTVMAAYEAGEGRIK